MDETEARARLDFLEKAEALKDTLRSGFTGAGRREDTASHSWRLCLWLVTFADAFEGLDLARALSMAVVHDLPEAVVGDTPATEERADKQEVERAGLAELSAALTPERRAALRALWEEYEAGESLEARVVKGLDKLETILQHTQGANPPGFDHSFNLHYGRAQTDAHPILALLRELVDERTRAAMQETGG